MLLPPLLKKGELPPAFVQIMKEAAVPHEDEYWTTEEIDSPEVEGRLRAAAFVYQGDELYKFRKNGREKPHKRFVRVINGDKGADMLWDKSKGGARERVVRADAEVYQSCFQGEQIPDEGACFQVILEKRMLFLMAESPKLKWFWIKGINAIVSGDVRRIDSDRNASGIAVQEVQTGTVYFIDYNLQTECARSTYPVRKQVNLDTLTRTAQLKSTYGRRLSSHIPGR